MPLPEKAGPTAADCPMMGDCPMRQKAAGDVADCPRGDCPMKPMAGSLAGYAYATFEIKSLDNDQRVIEGIASTPTPDRIGDIMNPLGAKFALPMPLLWQHDSKSPIGQVMWAEARESGIPFRAKIANVTEPGRLKDRLDEAWQSLKSGLVRFASIGFTAASDKVKLLKGGGLQYDEWTWLELSAVTIPANAEATITNIRSIDQVLRAASGDCKLIETVPAPSSPKAKNEKPASVLASRSIKLGATTMATKTNSERLKDLEAKRAAEAAARDAIQTKVADEDRTKDEAEQTAFDEHSATIKAIDRELADCRTIEKEMIMRAQPVIGDGSMQINNPGSIQVKAPVLEPGIALIKALACEAHAVKYHRDVFAVTRQFCGQWPQVENHLRTKAAVATGTTVGTTWAAPLVYPANLVADFYEFLVPQTFLGRIPGLTRVPFNSRVPRENSVITAQWVGEGRSKPVAAGSFDFVSLSFAKTACIMGVTDELVKFSSPSIETLVRNNLAKGIAKFTDVQFIDPSVAAIVGQNPASITNTCDHDAASGTDITAVIHDLREILFHFQEYNIPTDGLVLIMQPVLATSIGTMMTTLGVRQFPDINGNGGSVLGVQVITSNNSPSGQITAIHPPSVLLADDGGIQIDLSNEASVEMQDNPTSTDWHLVSAFQQNLLFVRAEQYITWARGRDKGVYYINAANYGGAVTG
jgi:HK97 family phage major capsid protein/HK97 family phage prohead protease